MAPRTPLLHPESYFERWDAFALWRPALVVVLLALTVLVGTAIVVGTATVRLPDGPPPGWQLELLGPLAGLFLGGLAVFLVSWLLNGVVLHAFVWYYEGRGSFRRVLAVAGWGMATAIPGIVLSLAFVSVAVGTASFSGNLQSAAEQLERVIDGSTPLGPVVPLAAAVWQAYVFRGGLVVGHDLSRRDATVAAGVVALGGALLNLL